jgi:hypothetical protein
MKPYAIVAEGPDDLAALRALLRTAGASVGGAIWEASPLKASLHRVDLSVYAARGKKKELAQRAIDAAEGGAITRPDAVVVCFDPDGEPAPSQFDFFAAGFEAVRGQRAGPLDKATLSFVLGGRTIRVLEAPWRLDNPASFDSLADEHNLERILITGILQAIGGGQVAAWEESGTSELMKLVSDHGWKRAFRIWNAGLAPKSEQFVDALLQNDAVKAHCLAALQASHAWRVISGLHV